ncbi:MAG TPA: transporter substrate-binding domain-containing protein [Acetobacteraceae bacterium]
MKSLLGAFLLLAGLGAAQAQTRPAFLPEAALRVCTDPGFAPMEFFRNPGDAQAVGFDMDLATALAARWGVPFRLQSSDFKGLLPGVDSGRCDMAISGMLVTEARKQRYDAVPYLGTHVVLMAARANAEVNKPEDLSGKVLAVEGGSNYENVAAKLNETLRAAGKPLVTVQTYPTPTAITEQVLLGRAAAAMTQDVEAAFRDQQLPGKLRIAYTYPETDRFGIYLKRDPAALAALREAIAALRADGTIAKLAAKWNIPETDVKLDDPS